MLSLLLMMACAEPPPSIPPLHPAAATAAVDGYLREAAQNDAEGRPEAASVAWSMAVDEFESGVEPYLRRVHGEAVTVRLEYAFARVYDEMQRKNGHPGAEGQVLVTKLRALLPEEPQTAASAVPKAGTEG